MAVFLSAAEQLMVESALMLQGSGYWLGLRRPKLGQPFAFTTGAREALSQHVEHRPPPERHGWAASRAALGPALVLKAGGVTAAAGDPVPQVVSNAEQYAHWGWQHVAAQTSTANNCVYAAPTQR